MGQGSPCGIGVLLLALLPGCDGGSRDLSVGRAVPSVDGYRPATPELLRARGLGEGLTVDELEGLWVGPVDPGWFRPLEARHARAADSPLDDAEPVLVHRSADGWTGWPLVHVLRHELALDELDGVPVAVTFCSLCSGARLLERRLDGVLLDLRPSGLLHGARGVLQDRASGTLFDQLTGEALAGPLLGRHLGTLPAFTVSLGTLRRHHPDARLMQGPPPGPDPPLELLTAEHLSAGTLPSWLHASCPTPLALEHLAPGAPHVVWLTDPATAPAHRTARGTLAPAVGTRAAFDPRVGERLLTFDGLRDLQTGTLWNPLGEAVHGPLAGARLRPLDQVVLFRFALEASSTPLR